MRVADVRKRYPDFFVTVEAAVWDDMLSINNRKRQPLSKPFNVHPDFAKRIAYNAAAIATLELHKIASRKN